MRALVNPHAAAMPSDQGSVTARLVERLTAAILEGRLAPGQRLVEANLQEEYGAGRSSVRESLQQLKAQGLVTISANRGASVRRLTRTEVVDLFEIRERLEGLAAFLAARNTGSGNADPAQVKALSQLLQQLTAAAQRADALAYGRLNRQLHEALLSLSGNRELVRLVQQLSLPIFHHQFRGFLAPENQRTSQAQHGAVVAAVLRGDANQAEVLMRRHVRDGLKLVQRWSDENFAG